MLKAQALGPEMEIEFNAVYIYQMSGLGLSKPQHPSL